MNVLVARLLFAFAAVFHTLPVNSEELTRKAAANTMLRSIEQLLDKYEQTDPEIGEKVIYKIHRCTVIFRTMTNASKEEAYDWGQEVYGIVGGKLATSRGLSSLQAVGHKLKADVQEVFQRLQLKQAFVECQRLYDPRQVERVFQDLTK